MTTYPPLSDDDGLCKNMAKLLIIVGALFLNFVSLNVIAQDLISEDPVDSDYIDESSVESENIVFISPARMSSSFLDSPNAVTSLDVPTLRLLGITDLVDAMRLVPGMMVSETHGSDVSVGYHGANVNVPRRSEVLYNSNRLHRPGYAGAHWYRLPIDLQDLNFIEVMRGPSPEYGTNAMTSTVNLIQDTVGTRGVHGSFRFGDADTQDIFLNGGWVFGDNQLGLRYFHRENSGFDGAVGFEGPYENDVSTDSIMVNWERRLSQNWLLDVAGSYADSDYKIPGYDHLSSDDPFVQRALANFRPSPDTEETTGFLSTKVHGTFQANGLAHELTVGANASTFERNQDVSLCGVNFTFDPRVAEIDALPSVHLASGDENAFIVAYLTGNLVLEHSFTQTPSDEELATIAALGPYLQSWGFQMLDERCGVTDQDLDENRYEINAHLISHFSSTFQNSFGFSYTHNKIGSDTYLAGTVSQDTFHVYDSVRYSPAPRWVLNGTLAFEYADNVDDTDAWSYRLAANYQLRSDLVFRVMHARSERLPDVYETSRDWSYFVVYDAGEVDHLGRSASHLTRRAVSPDGLEPEVLETTEVGLTFSRFNNIQADVKVFVEDYSDLISEAFNYVDFRLTNSGELDTKGIEFGVNHETQSGFQWGASFVYLDADSDTPFEQSLRPDKSGSLWGILPLGDSSHLSAVYYGTSDVAEGSYDRFDATFSHRITMKSGHIDLQLNYRRYPDGINAYTEFSSFQPNVATIDGQDRIFATVALSFY